MLCDTEHSVGPQYQVMRDPDDQFADYPKRIAYLLDADRTIVAAHEVTDPGGYGVQALSALAAAKR